MATKTWIGDGGAATDASVAANWSAAGVPVNGDTLVFNEQANRECVIAVAAANWAGIAFKIIETAGFRYWVGTGAEPFEPAEGITALLHSGAGLTPDYFQVPNAKAAAAVLINTTATRDDKVVLSGAGEVTSLVVRQGKCKLNTLTLASGGTATVLAPPGGGTSELYIPPSTTLTGSVINVQGGRVRCESAFITVNQSDGEFIHGGAVNGTTLNQYGGMFQWDATASTLTKVNGYGGSFRIAEAKSGRIITNIDTHPGHTLDMRIGGHLVTFTNPLRNYGGMVRMPLGTTNVFSL